MTSKDSAEDQELLNRYRRASDTDAAAPSDAVRSAILAESRRVADELAKEAPQHSFDVSRPAANDSRWKITAFGTAGAALLAALLIAPRYWESLPPAQQRTAGATAPTSARAPTAAPAAESKSANADAAGEPTATALSPTATGLARAGAPPKLESIAPSRRSGPHEMAALEESVVAPDKARDQPLDKKNAQLAQNYAPAPLALEPAPAESPAAAAQTEPARANDLVPAPPPAAPSADFAQNNIAGRPTSADRSGAIQGGFSRGAASAARERNALEPAGLQSAAAAGDLAQTTLLLDQGAAVNTRDALGRTPLLLAVAQNRLEVVRLLLARGADPNAADNAGVTPLQLAKDKELREVAALLERAGTR
jgi:hypothetical protein